MSKNTDFLEHPADLRFFERGKLKGLKAGHLSGQTICKTLSLGLPVPAEPPSIPGESDVLGTGCFNAA